MVADLQSGAEISAATALWPEEWSQLLLFYRPADSFISGVEVRVDESGSAQS